VSCEKHGHKWLSKFGWKQQECSKCGATKPLKSQQSEVGK